MRKSGIDRRNEIIRLSAGEFKKKKKKKKNGGWEEKVVCWEERKRCETGTGVYNPRKGVLEGGTKKGLKIAGENGKELLEI